jgi:hypothetical protein
MFLPFILDIATPTVTETAQTVVYALPPEYQLIQYILFGVIGIETALIVWSLYRDLTSLWCIDRIADGLFRIKKIAMKKVKDNKFMFKKESRTHEITTRVNILKRPLGINVPMVFVRSDFAGTVDLADPRNPKNQYIDPKVFAESLLAEAEKQLQTVHIEKKPLDFILPMLAGGGLVMIIAMMLGWFK